MTNDSRATRRVFKSIVRPAIGASLGGVLVVATLACKAPDYGPPPGTAPERVGMVPVATSSTTGDSPADAAAMAPTAPTAVDVGMVPRAPEDSRADASAPPVPKVGMMPRPEPIARPPGIVQPARPGFAPSARDALAAAPPERPTRPRRRATDPDDRARFAAFAHARKLA